MQTFNHAVDLIGREYNSTVRQNRVKNVLSTLRLQDQLDETGDAGEALTKVYKIITKLAPQVPMSHRGGAHKIEFLRNAVIGCEWATEPLSRISTHGLTFQQLYGELEAAHQMSKEARLAILRDNVRSRSLKPDEDESKFSGIKFSGQGRYAYRHNGKGSRASQRQAKRPFDPLQVMGCFNCGDPTT